MHFRRITATKNLPSPRCFKHRSNRPLSCKKTSYLALFNSTIAGGQRAEGSKQKLVILKGKMKS